MKRNSQTIVDEWLVSSAQAGDEHAFARLLQRWSPKLLGYANSQLHDDELAKDVTQTVLLQISKELPQVRDTSAFAKWAYQILQRRCIDAIRQKQARRRLSSELTEQAEVLSQQHGQNDLTEGIALSRALRHLSAEHAQVVRLYYLEGFSVNDISEIVSIASGTVKSRLFAARKQLSEEINNE